MKNVELTNDGKSVQEQQEVEEEINFLLENKLQDIQNPYPKENENSNLEDLQLESVVIKTTKYLGCRRYAGVIFALLAGLCFTVSSLIVKTLNNYHPINLSFWGYFGFTLPIIPMSLYYIFVKKLNIFITIWPLNWDMKNQKWKFCLYIWITSIFGCTTFFSRFYSLVYLTLADATVITFSGPVFTVISAHFCLKEKCGIVTIPIALWILLGVFIIARPPVITGQSEFSKDNLIGIGLGLSSVIFATLYFIIMRKLRQVHLTALSLMSGLWGLIQSIIIAYAMGVFNVPKGTHDILMIFTMGVLSLMGQMLVILALKWEQAGTVSLVRTCDVIFAFLWQLIFLNDIPDIFSYLGAVIIIIGVLLTTFRKWVSTLSEHNQARRIFGFLLK